MEGTAQNPVNAITESPHVWTLLKVVGIIILVSLIAWFIYKQGTKKTQQNKLPPNDSPGTNASSTTLSTLAGNLHNDMSGISWLTDHDEDYYNQALALSNYDFTNLVNIYNAQYQNADGKTFLAMLNSCWATPFTPFDTAKKAMIAKLAANNITN